MENTFPDWEPPMIFQPMFFFFYLFSFLIFSFISNSKHFPAKFQQWENYRLLVKKNYSGVWKSKIKLTNSLQVRNNKNNQLGPEGKATLSMLFSY